MKENQNQTANRNEKPRPLHSVDNMNSTLRITRRWAWLVLIVLLLVTLAILLSIFYIKVPTQINTPAYGINGEAIAFVDVSLADDLEVGQDVLIDKNLKGKIKSISSAVFSSVEAAEQVDSQYIRYMLNIPDWVVRVEVDYTGELEKTMVHPMVITTGEISLSAFFVGAG